MFIAGLDVGVAGALEFVAVRFGVAFVGGLVVVAMGMCHASTWYQPGCGRKHFGTDVVCAVLIPRRALVLLVYVA